MTERLYYDNSLLREFEARAVALINRDGRQWVKLDRSAFYPTSGGQPHDTGILAADGKRLRVEDVTVDDAGDVWHLTDGETAVGTPVHGLIDWPRRLDLMEQHAGEHLIAGAIWREFGGVTAGLHTGQEDATIDVSLPSGQMRLGREEIGKIESIVNEEIRQNVPVRCYFPSREELAHVPLRKPPTVTEHVRVVQYGDFEYCACGGTHPPFSGMIGCVKILSVLPSRGKARVSFVCGGRALRRFQRLYTVTQEACESLSCAQEGLPESIGKLQESLRESRASLQRLERDRVEEHLRSVPPRSFGKRGKTLIAAEVPECGRQALTEGTAAALKENTVILARCAESGIAVFARGEGICTDMGKLFRLIGERGGGKPDFASGTVVKPDSLLRAAEIIMEEEE